MLLMEAINPYLCKKPEKGEPTLNCKVTNVEELIGKTMCNDVESECFDRKCEKKEFQN